MQQDKYRVWFDGHAHENLLHRKENDELEWRENGLVLSQFLEEVRMIHRLEVIPYCVLDYLITFLGTNT